PGDHVLCGRRVFLRPAAGGTGRFAICRSGDQRNVTVRSALRPMTRRCLGRRLPQSPNPAGKNPARMFGASTVEDTMAISTWWPAARRTRGPTRRGPRFLAWTGGTVAVLLALGSLGALYESAAEARDARAYPPPGQ